jgi:hypothetical protein
MPNSQLGFVYDDGGRAEAGYKGTAGDCVCRSIAIATGLQYGMVYKQLNQMAKLERTGKRKRGRSSAGAGVFRTTYERLLTQLGWVWTPTMFIGQGCKVHMRRDELPSGPLIVSLSGHLSAVLDGVEYSTYRSDREGTRCVYGYWAPPA